MVGFGGLLAWLGGALRRCVWMLVWVILGLPSTLWLRHVGRTMRSTSLFAILFKLEQRLDRCIVQDLHKDVEWNVYSDAELAGSTEPQACRRSQLGYMMCLGQCPVVWQSKCSTVQFDQSAHPAGFSAMKPVTAHP